MSAQEQTAGGKKSSPRPPTFHRRICRVSPETAGVKEHASTIRERSQEVPLHAGASVAVRGLARLRSNPASHRRALEADARPPGVDEDPGRTGGSTEEWLRGRKWGVLDRPGRSPDPNPVEMLWGACRKSPGRPAAEGLGHGRAVDRSSELMSDRWTHTHLFLLKGGNTNF